MLLLYIVVHSKWPTITNALPVPHHMHELYATYHHHAYYHNSPNHYSYKPHPFYYNATYTQIVIVSLLPDQTLYNPSSLH